MFTLLKVLELLKYRYIFISIYIHFLPLVLYWWGFFGVSLGFWVGFFWLGGLFFFFGEWVGCGFFFSQYRFCTSVDKAAVSY